GAGLRRRPVFTTPRSDMSEAGCAIGIIMGSQSDWETMQHVAHTLDRLGISYETRIISAHRTPERLYQYDKSAQGRGLKLIIAGALDTWRRSQTDAVAYRPDSR